MKQLSLAGAVFLILVVGLCLSCGGSTERTSPADEEAAVAEGVESAVDAGEEAAGEAAEEAEMSLDDLEAELADKVADLDTIDEQLKGLSPEELMGDKGKELKAKSEALNDEIQKIKKKIDSLSQ